MKIVGVIPARMGSTRLPRKPLQLIAGKPLLEWVVRGAQQSKHLSELWVATDHAEIAKLAEGLGVKAVMTDPALASGTDRVHQAIEGVSDVDVVLNIQGDEPLITGELLDQLIEPMQQDKSLPMATVARPLQLEDLQSKMVVKVVLNKASDAIYFSRWPIPYSRVDATGRETVCLQHIGLYAFRRSFLTEFCATKPTPLELAESLEQLRALYLGAKIRVVPVEHESWGVDTPEDVAKVENLLSQRR